MNYESSMNGTKLYKSIMYLGSYWVYVGRTTHHSSGEDMYTHHVFRGNTSELTRLH